MARLLFQVEGRYRTSHGTAREIQTRPGCNLDRNTRAGPSTLKHAIGFGINTHPPIALINMHVPHDSPYAHRIRPRCFFVSLISIVSFQLFWIDNHRSRYALATTRIHPYQFFIRLYVGFYTPYVAPLSIFRCLSTSIRAV